MRKFKKMAAVVLAGAMCLSIAGCTKPGTTTEGTTTENIEISPHVTEETTSVAEATTEIVVDDVTYATEKNVEFDTLCMDYFKEAVTGDSLSYNFLVKDGSVYGIEAPEATYGELDFSDAAVAEQEKEDREFLEKVRAFDPSTLTRQQAIDREYVIYAMEKDLITYDYQYLSEPFSPMRGIQANLPTNFTDYRFDDKSDVETYIALLNQMPEYFQAYLDWDRVKAEKGYSVSDSVMDEIIEQCNTFIGDGDSNHFMIEVFNNRIDELSFLTEEEKAEYKKQDEEAVLNSMIPAFQLCADTFTELKGTGKVEGGICNYEGGKEYYENYLLPKFTGSSKSALEIKSMLEDRIQQSMMSLYSVYAKNQDAYNYFLEQNAEVFTKEDGKEPSAMVDDLMKNYMSDFPEMGTIPYSVNYLDKSMETILDSVLAYYMSPAIDDLQGNIIYVNGMHTSGVWTTLAHEGCPGHMFQNAYYVSTNPNPIRLISNELGYMEGWAVYSAYEVQKKYDFGTEYNSLLADLVRANSEISYAIYGVMDIGVNYEGWTVEDCEKFMTESGFGSEGAAYIYDTVVGDPAVYLSYSAGYYEMLSQRERAEEALGDKFDPVAFHTVILSTGPCQYDLLTKTVNEYIVENQ